MNSSIRLYLSRTILLSRSLKPSSGVFRRHLIAACALFVVFSSVLPSLRGEIVAIGHAYVGNAVYWEETAQNVYYRLHWPAGLAPGRYQLRQADHGILMYFDVVSTAGEATAGPIYIHLANQFAV